VPGGLPRRRLPPGGGLRRGGAGALRLQAHPPEVGLQRRAAGVCVGSEGDMGRRL
jgi:hypothetical protein